MGIGNDDGTHDLYLASVFADGSTGATYTGDLVVATRAPGGQDLPADQWRQHPLSEVVGYAVTCECMSAYGYTAQPTVLAQWRRVNDAAEQDFDQGRVYAAAGENAMDISERPEVEDAMRRHWAQHLAPRETRAQLRAAWTRHRQALADVNTAVQAARAAGASWVEVGDATGMTRQSARERWGTS